VSGRLGWGDGTARSQMRVRTITRSPELKTSFLTLPNSFNDHLCVIYMKYASFMRHFHEICVIFMSRDNFIDGV
jgi:hypothetical protein